MNNMPKNQNVDAGCSKISNFEKLNWMFTNSCQSP